jgi:hypothetical protein
MGVEETRRVQGPAPWAGEAGLNNARPRPEEQPPRPANPSKARTPQEALTYIEQLYKSGRMEDLAALLRRSSVFRVAWLILQQSSPASLKAAGCERRFWEPWGYSGACQFAGALLILAGLDRHL